MKRKIQAKMKSRGTSSHDGLAQEIAVSIVDKNEGTPAVSPLIRNAESRKDAWLDSPSSISPIPSEVHDLDTDSKQPLTTFTSPEHHIAGPSASPITISVLDNTGAAESPLTLVQTPPPVDTPMNDAPEDDEEAHLLAELEAERLAEEKARQKRRALEDRLASARGKKLQRSASAVPERVGSGDQVEPVQTLEDSTSSLF
jgi:hypothetical protein